MKGAKKKGGPVAAKPRPIKKNKYDPKYTDILEKLKIFSSSSLVESIIIKLDEEKQIFKPARLKLLQYLRLSKESLSSCEPCDILNNLREIFETLFLDVSNDSKVIHNDKHLEFESKWYHAIGRICDIFFKCDTLSDINKLYESETPAVASQILVTRQLLNGIVAINECTKRDAIAIMHHIAGRVFDVLTKQVLLNKNSAPSQDNLSTPLTLPERFRDEDQKLQLTCLAGGCIGQIVANLKKITKDSHLSESQKLSSNTSLNLINAITMNAEEKSFLPICLKERDRGGMYFLRAQFYQFLLAFDQELHRVATPDNMKKYGENTVKFIYAHMKNVLVIENEFKKAIEEIEAVDFRLYEIDETTDIYKIFIRKLIHASIGAFFNSYIQVKQESKSSLRKGGQMLRDDLYGIVSKKKGHARKEKPIAEKQNTTAASDTKAKIKRKSVPSNLKKPICQTSSNESKPTISGAVTDSLTPVSTPVLIKRKITKPKKLNL